MIRKSTAVVCFVALLAGVGSSAASAAEVQLTFTGTYDTGESTVFGQSGPAVPYSYTIDYDTALDTNTQFLATGATVGITTTTHEWHGYSKSGITATSLTFGTQTWTLNDLDDSSIAVGVTADLWFNVDISQSVPTLGSVSFMDANERELWLGVVNNDGINTYMLANSFVGGGSGGFSNNMVIASSVPEPAALALLPLGGLALLRRGRRRR